MTIGTDPEPHERAHGPGGIVSLLLVAVDFALLATLVLLPLVWLHSPVRVDWLLLHLTVSWGWKPVLAPVLLLVGRILAARWAGGVGPVQQGLFKRLAFKRLILALTSAYVFVAAAEGVLILADFKAELPPIVIVGKDADGTEWKSETIQDPVLIYRLRPGANFGGRLVNRLGFLGREVEPAKAPGTVRVICMGDSVTAQGLPGYAQYLHELLTNRPPTPGRWEAFNMAVHGYTSLQGLKSFQTQVRALQPDIVTLYYGWNDHWLSDKSDRQQMGLVMGIKSARVFEALRAKRIFQFAIWALNPVLHLARLGRSPDPLDYKSKQDVFEGRVYRVDPDEYRATLTAFVAEIRRAGAVPIVVTAPLRDLTDAIVTKRYIRSIEEGNRLHERYVELTREVARRTGAPLLDLAALLAGPECNRLFAPDGIHFDLYAEEPALTAEVTPDRQPGLVRVATELDAKIRAIVGSDEWRLRRIK